MADCVPAQLRALRDFCDKIPGHRRGSRTHLSTLIRWATDGVKTPRGERVKLRAVRAGAKWLTTDEWFQAFIETLTEASQPGGSTAAPIRSPTVRRRESEAAEQRVIARGVK